MLMALCMAATMHAQKAFMYKDKELVSDKRTVYVSPKDSTDAEHGVFSSFNEAMKYVSSLQGDTVWTNVYIEPSVYWLDNPDDKAVRVPKKGKSTPYALELELMRTRMIGLGEKPEDVVLAVNRGQTQGAEGNYTMMHIDGSYIEAENITFGNYCNVDLVYPRDSTLNRPRRKEAIVQAQLVIADGEHYHITNCRFISRLNLCPFVGPQSVVFDSCYFECTDDALCGTGIYRHCKFTFYSSKPFYSTSRQGAVFMDCDIHSKVKGKQYLTKVQDPVWMIDCRWTSDDPDLEIKWTPKADKTLRCYQSNVTLNGQPYIIDKSHGIDITDKKVLKGFKTEDGQYKCEYLPMPYYIYNPVVKLREDIEEEFVEYKKLKREDGCEAVQTIRHIPTELPQPNVTKELTIKREGNTLTASYAVDTEGHKDKSDITWFRRYGSGKCIPVLRANVDTLISSYEMGPEDAGNDVICMLTPRTNRSMVDPQISPLYAKENCMAWTGNVRLTNRPKENSKPSVITDTLDLRTFPILRQRYVIGGAWTLDVHKPTDIKDRAWQSDSLTLKPWIYGKGVDGAEKATGLIEATRGARMMYTPMKGKYGKMSLTAKLCPCKSAGQGFGSATDQYLDLCIKFDTRTLTGYGVRFIRVPYLDKAVEVCLVKYSNGKKERMGVTQVCKIFKTGCKVKIEYKNNKVVATVTNSKQKDVKVELGEEGIKDNGFGGIHIQHTGTVGPSATVIQDIRYSITQE